MHRILAVALGAVAVAASCVGCTSTSGGCIDSIALPTAQDRYDAAPQVVVATVERTDRTVETRGIYRVLRARTERVLKGAAPGEAFDLVSTSDQCWRSGRPVEYVEGDVLAKPGRYVLYLSDTTDHGVRALFVPGAADALPQGAPLPFSTTNTTPDVLQPTPRGQTDVPRRTDLSARDGAGAREEIQG